MTTSWTYPGANTRCAPAANARVPRSVRSVSSPVQDRQDARRARRGRAARCPARGPRRAATPRSRGRCAAGGTSARSRRTGRGAPTGRGPRRWCGPGRRSRRRWPGARAAAGRRCGTSRMSPAIWRSLSLFMECGGPRREKCGGGWVSRTVRPGHGWEGREKQRPGVGFGGNSSRVAVDSKAAGARRLNSWNSNNSYSEHGQHRGTARGGSRWVPSSRACPQGHRFTPSLSTRRPVCGTCFTSSGCISQVKGLFARLRRTHGAQPGARSVGTRSNFWASGRPVQALYGA